MQRKSTHCRDILSGLELLQTLKNCLDEVVREVSSLTTPTNKVLFQLCKQKNEENNLLACVSSAAISLDIDSISY